MLRKYLPLSLGFMVAFWLLAACGASATVYPLRVSSSDGLPNYFQGSVTIPVENVNKDCIVFPYDFGAKIFYEENNERYEIKNLMGYSPHDDITLGAKGEFSAESAISFTPDLSGLTISNSTHFIVRISGVMCKNGKPFTQEIPFTMP
jgi:hypothetical protein